MLFLDGKRDELVLKLRSLMEEASAAMDYERAALFRDRMRAVETALESRSAPGFADDRERDLIGMAREGSDIEIFVLRSRDGRLFDRARLSFSDQEFPDGEILSSFLVRWYEDPSSIPDEVLLSRSVDDAHILGQILSERAGRRVTVSCPSAGQKRRILDTADENASHALRERMARKASARATLEALRRDLGLKTLPSKIECVDVSHLGGGETVGALSRVVDGRLDAGGGRTYRLRAEYHGDDLAALSEILERRFERAVANERGWEAPDLLVIDGGRAHLAAARAVLDRAGARGQEVVAIAKDRDGDRGDRVFVVGRKNPLSAKRGQNALAVLSMARDEAHRLAVSYQRKTRRQKTRASLLDTIDGVGPELKARLLTEFGSLKGVSEATEEDLGRVRGVGPVLAARIAMAVRRSRGDGPDPG